MIKADHIRIHKFRSGLAEYYVMEINDYEEKEETLVKIGTEDLVKLRDMINETLGDEK